VACVHPDRRHVRHPAHLDHRGRRRGHHLAHHRERRGGRTHRDGGHRVHHLVVAHRDGHRDRWDVLPVHQHRRDEPREEVGGEGLAAAGWACRMRRSERAAAESACPTPTSAVWAKPQSLGRQGRRSRAPLGAPLRTPPRTPRVALAQPAQVRVQAQAPLAAPGPGPGPGPGPQLRVGRPVERVAHLRSRSRPDESGRQERPEQPVRPGRH
jgi:hypothetical protein